MKYWSTFLIFISSSVALANTSPPLEFANKPTHGIFHDFAHGPVAGIKALLLKPWADGGATGWQELSGNWAKYGTTPLTLNTMTTAFTFNDLVASGADVLILSDPAGGTHQFSPEEMKAISDYVAAGHNIVGTYAVFKWAPSSSSAYDNHELAAVFGLLPTLDFEADYTTSTFQISNSFVRVLECNPLAPYPTWQSQGWPYSQMPMPAAMWPKPAMPFALAVATSDNYRAVITLRREKTYSAIYFSSMPEDNGSTVDYQLLYNAITFKRCN